MTRPTSVTPVLAGFGGYWVSLATLPFLLLLFSLAPSSYSNWALLFLFTLLAHAITGAVGRLCEWPNGTLVPGFAAGVFLICIGSVVGTALVSILFAWLRDVVPAVGPAILAGLGTVALARRFGRHVCPAAIVIVVLGVVWDRDARSLDAMLAEPWVQAFALVLAAVAAMDLWHSIKLPAGRVVESRILPKPRGGTRAVVLSALWLAGVALCLLLEPLSGMLFALSALYVLGVLDQVVGGFEAIHMQLSWNWILATTQSRTQLARRCTGRLVVRSLSWFPAGVSATTLQWLDVQQNPLFHVLLLIHITALLLIAFLAGVVRPWPQKGMPWLVIGVPPTFFLAFVALLVGLLFEHTLLGYALLVAAFIVSALFALFVGGRGLAKAEVVE